MENSKGRKVAGPLWPDSGTFAFTVVPQLVNPKIARITTMAKPWPLGIILPMQKIA